MLYYKNDLNDRAALREFKRKYPQIPDRNLPSAKTFKRNYDKFSTKFTVKNQVCY